MYCCFCLGEPCTLGVQGVLRLPAQNHAMSITTAMDTTVTMATTTSLRGMLSVLALSSCRQHLCLAHTMQVTLEDITMGHLPP